MTLEPDAFLIFSLKQATKADPEVDFVINDIKYVGVAISTAGIEDLTDKEEQLKTKFPSNMILVTPRSVFSYLELIIEIRGLEAELIEGGALVSGVPRNDRHDQALNWDGKHDVARQIGNC